MQLVPDTQGPPRTISLRLKLTIWMVVISSTLQLTLAVIVMLYQRQALSKPSVERIAARVEAASDVVRNANFQVNDDLLKQLTIGVAYVPQFERALAVLYTEAGEVVASSVRPAPSASEIDITQALVDAAPYVTRQYVAGLYDDDAERFKSRVAMQHLRSSGQGNFVLVVARTDLYFDTVMSVTSRALVMSLLIGILATAIGGWMIARLATAPLEDLRRIAGSLSPEGIQEDIQLRSAPREIGELERDLLDARSRLRAALLSKDRFITNVSHELKTPIAVLLTESQTLRQEGMSPEGRKFVQSVTEEMRRLGRMVESFLTLTKIHGVKELVHGQVQNVNEVVMESVGDCIKLARQYQVTLAPQLASKDTEPCVSGDADLLRVMVDNLITNAIRFSPQDSRVLIEVRVADADCIIVIRDFGPGVPEEMLSKVFDRFVQRHEHSARGTGHGLGLSIAQGVAELHGGEINIQNMPGGGCEFQVRLPLVREAIQVPSATGA